MPIADATNLAPLEVAMQQPALYIALGAFLILVTGFLYYLKTRDHRDAKRDEAVTQTVKDISERHDETTREMAAQCHALQRETIGRYEALQRESNEVHKEATKAMVLVTEHLRTQPKRRD